MSMFVTALLMVTPKVIIKNLIQKFFGQWVG